jgi:hypothetical protein
VQHLPDTSCESKESMIRGLAILGNTCRQTTSGGQNDKHITIGCFTGHMAQQVFKQ